MSYTNYSNKRLDWIVFADNNIDGIYKNHFLQDILDKLPRDSNKIYHIETINDKFINARDLPVVDSDGIINISFGETYDKFDADKYLDLRYGSDNITKTSNVYAVTQTDFSLAQRGLKKLNETQKQALINSIKNGGFDDNT